MKKLKAKLVKPVASEICQRIAQIRRELYGPRGRADFAQALGLSASSYNYYEKDREPPAAVLVKIAQLAGVDVHWLLTGRAAPQAVPADHPALQRIALLLSEHPDAAAPLAAFVEILATSLSWPAKTAAAGATNVAGATGEAPLPGLIHVAHPPSGVAFSLPPQPRAAEPHGFGSKDNPSEIPQTVNSVNGPGPSSPQNAWIPVLGRSAAGLPQFWNDPADAAGTTTLGALIQRQARRSPRQVAPARSFESDGSERQVQLVTLSEPNEQDVAEFVVARHLKGRYADAYAVRIDGDSMSPEIRHGDLVICSPSVPAAQGQLAVVQLENQVGVTCKLFRRQAGRVHLVPINEQYPPQDFPADKLVWAHRVLGRVRPGR